MEYTSITSNTEVVAAPETHKTSPSCALFVTQKLTRAILTSPLIAKIPGSRSDYALIAISLLVAVALMAVWNHLVGRPLP